MILSPIEASDLYAKSRAVSATAIVDQLKHRRRGVTDALKVSYDLLTTECKVAAHDLAQLAPEPIPEMIIEELSLASEVRRTLRERSFVLPSGEGFGVMHRLMADFLRTTGGETYGDEWANLGHDIMLGMVVLVFNSLL